MIDSTIGLVFGRLGGLGVVVLGVVGGCSLDDSTTATPAAETTASATTAAPSPAKESPKPPSKPSKPTVLKESGRYQVVRVVDGDTVKIAYHGTTTVRLIGIDTPEIDGPRKPVECGGPEASNAAKKLLDGKTVGLAFDPNGDRLDNYGRTLAYITLPDGRDFGTVMLKRGHADLFYSASHPRQHAYRNALETARAHDRGLWADANKTCQAE